MLKIIIDRCQNHSKMNPTGNTIFVWICDCQIRNILNVILSWRIWSFTIFIPFFVVTPLAANLKRVVIGVKDIASEPIVMANPTSIDFTNCGSHNGIVGPAETIVVTCPTGGIVGRQLVVMIDSSSSSSNLTVCEISAKGVSHTDSSSLWRHMAIQIWVNIGLGNYLLLESTKPLPAPMLIYHQICPVIFACVQFNKKCSWT